MPTTNSEVKTVDPNYWFNRKFWDKLKTTDPRMTKPIDKGWGKLTTIDPQWQIMRMTETFGPIGWGWKHENKFVYTDKLVFAEVTIYWRDDDTKALTNSFGPISSVQNLFKTNAKLDDEAPKKAMTDAMTKAFSHLGLCADVFMGKFDSSKYVDELYKEFNIKGHKEVKNDK